MNPIERDESAVLDPEPEPTRMRVHERGFAFVDGAIMRGWLERLHALDDWAAFAASWERLGPDPYLARLGRDRRRRHAVFTAERNVVRREPHQPHYQAIDYNPLQGGIERWFEPVEDAIANGDSLRSVLAFAHGFFAPLAPEVDAWHVEAHQFRIEARPDQPGQPTPEGVHRDGVDYVLVLLIERHNIASGTTTIHDAEGREVGSFTLTHPFDAALVDDARVMHGVTPVTALDPEQASHRDVLVVTLRRKS